MNDSQLRSFLIIADCGSFSQAENILFLSKQALKKQMDALEEELQCPLFLRSSQGLRLTEAGTAFLTAAPEILRRMEDAGTLCRQAHLQRRPVRVTVSNHLTLLLAQPTWRFCQENPDIQVQFCLVPTGAFSPPHEILSGITDVYVVSLNLQTAQPVEYTFLTRLPYKCLLAPDHPLARERGPLDPGLLTGHQVTMNRFSWSPQIIDALSPYCPVAVREEATASELELAYNTCLSGGVYVTSAYYTDQLPVLTARPLALPLYREIGLLYGAAASPEIRRYVRAMKTLMDAQPPNNPPSPPTQSSSP